MRTSVHAPTPVAIFLMARALHKGHLVAVPTETVYGLAGNAFDSKACRAIFRAKGRPSNDPLIVHVRSLAEVPQLAEINDAALVLAKAFWPGPLTLVLPKKDAIPDIVTSGRPSVAIRVPSHPVFRRLLKASGLPLAAPSANPFGYISPTTADHVRESLNGKIPHILDGGPCKVGLESTIVDLRNPSKPVLLRPGAISRQDLERALGRRVSLPRRTVQSGRTAAVAPGMLSRHYSPKTPLILHPKLNTRNVALLPSDEAILFFRRRRALDASNVFWLSESGDTAEAGRNLFAKLRSLDRQKWKRIHVEIVPGKSALSDAINDRLTRAAAKRRPRG